MSKGNVPISNIFEEMNLVAIEGKSSANRMDGRIAPSFIEEATIFI